METLLANLPFVLLLLLCPLMMLFVHRGGGHESHHARDAEQGVAHRATAGASPREIASARRA